MMGNKRYTSILALLLAILLLFTACADGNQGGSSSPADIPSGGNATSPYAVVNDNVPYFEDSEITDEAFESYSELDALGRCGVAFACIGVETMPTEDRDFSLSSVTPSGWEYNGKSNKNTYPTSIVPGGYIYNRCHLIGFQLTAETTNRKNLITGTKYLNIEGMLPFENMVADFIKETGYHVMYRATPIYEEYNLLASGVMIEAYSVEDSGEGICFCIYAYNVQPGIEIDYFTGENKLSGDVSPEDAVETTRKYVINTDSGKVHLEECHYAKSLKEENRAEFEGTLTELLAEYPECTQCGSCKAFEKP